MKFNKYWFVPKRFGYGAMPNTWEGWTLIALYILIIVSSIKYLMFVNRVLFGVFVFAMLFILVYVSKIKTKGDWKWRWNGV